MKKDIHPQYKALTIDIKGRKYHTMSTYPAETLIMDIDYTTHPAWTGKGFTAANESNTAVSSFNKKFAGLNFGIK
ncbi:hypothetical protein phytr_3180 [Candidatus Phycorickettsia trachydisci]|uniref:50S ribosomal protein L31 n=1 Tax=Candidatus Phycorickettsia trachydisci TaxID=2115978 RepID=A0A2P1P7N5_9RICK|nr:50S ribosomal protein L31 [Candidatus Phycorickettsia trachydisci]AVP87272.1 hypothetical protein phytr_3180 [Candidatus Phycorickettsia trachydisci]